MSNNSYYELLRDPQWQRKRLEIMQRADFECEECGSKDSTLSVHHSYYEKGLMPWDYPSESLHCLCWKCHQQAQELMLAIKRMMGKVGVYHWRLEQILGYLTAHADNNSDDPGAQTITITSRGMASGVGDVWGLTEFQVEALCDSDGTLPLNRVQAVCWIPVGFKPDLDEASWQKVNSVLAQMGHVEVPS